MGVWGDEDHSFTGHNRMPVCDGRGEGMTATYESTVDYIKNAKLLAEMMLNDNPGDKDLRGIVEKLELTIDALEKQIPKKIAIINTDCERICVCPVCGVDTPNPRELEMWEWWCPDCGQRLDWGKM